MSKLQELIRELCPNGVEYKKLGEIADYPKERTSIKEIDCYVGVENLLKDKQGVCKSKIMPNSESAILFIPNDILIGNIRPYLKKIWLADTTGGTNGDVVLIRVNKNYDQIVNRKFLYFILSSDSFFIYDNNYAKGGKMPRGDKSKIKEYEIPLPPLEVQEEIVRILDHFTNLAAELQTELQARKEQYEYYRNKLLTFDKTGGTQSVTWMKMSEICNLQRGKVYSKEYLRDNLGSYPVYSSQTMNNGELGRISTYDFDGTYLTWTTDGAYAGTIFKRKGRFSITNVCGIISMKSNLVTIDFLYYWLSLKAKEYVYSGMGNPKLMSNQVEKIPVPIFSISEQQRIVSILDKFEALVNDLTEGLPAEISAVQEQYEYYRNKKCAIMISQ